MHVTLPCTGAVYQGYSYLATNQKQETSRPVEACNKVIINSRKESLDGKMVANLLQ